MSRAAPAAAAVALVGVVWVLLHGLWYPHGQLTDYAVYRTYGDDIVHRHLVPYRDFRLEYQPAALPVFIVPALLEQHGFSTVFQVVVGLCDLALVLAVLRLRGLLAAVGAAVAPLLLGSVVLSRFDLWPAALVAIGLWLLLSNRPRLSGIVLGTAIAAKLWPLVLAPPILLWLWDRDRDRARAWWRATGTTTLLWFVPFVIVGARGVGHSFYAQFARPLQIESLGSSILLTIHDLFHTKIGVDSSFGSQNAAGPAAHAVGMVSSLAEAVAVVAAWVLFARGPRTSDRLFLACAAATTALMAFGKVFSPQYLIWLFALVPLVRTGRWRAAWAVGAIALIGTQAYFPRRYWALASGLHRTEVGLLLLRDLAVVLLFGLLIYMLDSRASSSRVSAAVS